MNGKRDDESQEFGQRAMDKKSKIWAFIAIYMDTGTVLDNDAEHSQDTLLLLVDANAKPTVFVGFG